MESHPFPTMLCILCSEAVNLQIDLCADEHGKSLHEQCYLKRITNSFGNPLTSAIGD
jgi:hypothetical protein